MGLPGLNSRSWQGCVPSGSTVRGSLFFPFPASRGQLHFLACGAPPSLKPATATLRPPSSSHLLRLACLPLQFIGMLVITYIGPTWLTQSTLEWYTTSHLSEWLLLKRQEIPSVGKDVGKREPWYTVGGNVNWRSHYGKQYGGSFISSII